HATRAPRPPHTFPTRRSSDLAELDAILTLHAPMLRDLQGVGTDVASQLLVTVGDNPERVTTEAKFAALVGVAPIPASSGKTSRQDRKSTRLNSSHVSISYAVF